MTKRIANPRKASMLPDLTDTWEIHAKMSIAQYEGQSLTICCLERGLAACRNLG
jgi:hypothetical protein